MPKGGKLSRSSLIIQGLSGIEEQVHFIQPLLVNGEDRFEMHEFLFVPDWDCNLLGRDLMAKLGM